MTPAPRVCVVGAGAIGLASALALARRGAGEVTVLEARHVAAGSSGLSVGVVETQYLDALDIELRVFAMRAFDQLEREHGLAIVRNGYLRLAHDAATVTAFERSVATQRSLGVADARVLDQREIAQLVPDMAVADVAGGLYGPHDGFLDGHLYCALLAELADAHGATLRSGWELLQARPRATEGWLLRTSGGELECDCVVDAAGPWAGRVAALLGAEMPLHPQRHQAVVVHLPHELPYTMPMVMDYTPAFDSGEGIRESATEVVAEAAAEDAGGDGYDASGLYFRHERPGQLIAGLHRDEASAEAQDPDRYSRAADPEFLEAVAAGLAARLPSLAAARLAHGWAGLYPASPDGLPQVGPAAGISSVILAGGAGGAGIQLAPAIGELVADWVLLGEPRAVAGACGLSPERASLNR